MCPHSPQSTPTSIPVSPSNGTNPVSANPTSTISTSTAAVVVVGAGPAGIAAAEAAAMELDAHHINDPVVLIERARSCGGILNQCIHNGFGLITYQEELTGPEYAERAAEGLDAQNIHKRTNTTVIDIHVKEDGTKEVWVVSACGGVECIHATALVLTMGCRERSRGNLAIPGARPQGVFSAGLAQRLINLEGVMPGREVVILGSGDIGLIMARRMTLEGAHVQCVAELLPYSSGLKRNIVQCLDDFGIPLKLSHTIVDIKGSPRVTSVVLAQVDKNFAPIPGTEEEIACDCVLLSVGLIPEVDVARATGIELDAHTKGPCVNQYFETSVPGIFAAGNVLHVHDLVDYVTREARVAGHYAAKFAQAQGEGLLDRLSCMRVFCGEGIGHVVPQQICFPLVDDVLLQLRVRDVFEHAELVVMQGDRVCAHRRFDMLVPGQMEQVPLKASALDQSAPADITVFVRTW